MARKRSAKAVQKLETQPAEMEKTVNEEEQQEKEEMVNEAVVVAVVSAASAMMTFGTCLHGLGFCWDDWRALIRNKDVTSGSGWELFLHDFWGDEMTDKDSHKSYRPISTLSYRLDVVISGGVLSGDVMHRRNVVLHGINTFLVAILAFFGPTANRERRKGETAPVVTSLLFACHSVHTEVIAGLVGRAELLACTFFILTILAYQRDLFLVSTCCAILATFAKETGVTVLGYLVFLELFSQHVRWAGRLLPLISILSAVLYIRLKLHHGTDLYEWSVLENHIYLEQSRLRRISTYMYCHARYALMLIWPYPLSYDHGFASIELYDFPPPLALLMYTAVILLLVYSIVKSDLRVLHCLIIAALPFIPAANIFFPIGAILAERLLYIPSVGFCLLVGLVFDRGCGYFKLKKLPLLSFFVVFLVMVMHSASSARAWKDNPTLFQNGFLMEPRSLKTINNFAHLQMKSGNLSKAKELFQLALEKVPTFPSALHNLGITHRLLGEEKEACDALRRAIAANPSSCTIAGLLGDQLLRYSALENLKTGKINMTMVDEAEVYLRRSRSTCTTPYATFNLGIIEEIRGSSLEKQVELMVLAMEESSKPGVQSDETSFSASNYEIIGDKYLALGDLVAATTYFEKAVESENPRIEIYIKLGVSGWIALYEKYGTGAQYTFTNGTRIGALEKSRMVLRQGLAIATDKCIFFQNIGWSYELDGDLDLAEEFYQKSLAEHSVTEPIARESLRRIETKRMQKQT